MKQKVTSKDVARLAGVSQPTVSMILNNYSNVSFSEETVQRVYDACRTLGYVTPSAKNSSRNIDGRLILLVSPNFKNEYFFELMDAAQAAALNRGYHLLTFDSCRDAALEFQIVQLASALRVAGVLLLYHPVNTRLINQLALSTPVVAVYNSHAQATINSLDMSSREIGALTAEHLLGLGHHRVAFITMPMNGISRSREERLEGLRGAFQAAGLPAGNVLALTAEGEGLPHPERRGEYETGYRLTQTAMEKYDVTAFVGSNDMVAMGIMDAILDAKKRIPQDYSVVGCDNTLVSKYRSVLLTTVEVFSIQRCEEAVSILIRKIEQGSDDEKENTPVSIVKMEYTPKLIVRKSTAPNRRRA